MADQLTPEKFDQSIAGRSAKLWGARTIAAYLGLSEDTVRRWAKDPNIPIFSPTRGTYFATRGELDAWLRGKPSA